MDVTIVVFSLVAFIAFLLLQGFVFRRVHQDDAVRWLGKLYCMTGATLVLVTVESPTVAGLSFVLYSGFVFVYSLCIFAPIEASLTLRILTEAAQAGRRGLHRGELLRRYNKHSIVKRRLDRLVRSGDLVLRRGIYVRTGTTTAYMMRHYGASIFSFFFP